MLALPLPVLQENKDSRVVLVGHKQITPVQTDRKNQHLENVSDKQSEQLLIPKTKSLILLVISKEQVKDIPTNARYAVYQGKSKAKENVRDLTSSISQTKADRASGRKEQQEQRRKTIAERRSEMEQVKQKNSQLLPFMKDQLLSKNNLMMDRPQNNLLFRLHAWNLNKPNRSVQQLSPIL